MTLWILQGGRTTVRPYKNRADTRVCPYQNPPNFTWSSSRVKVPMVKRGYWVSDEEGMIMDEQIHVDQGVSEMPKIGEKAPDFALSNQDGKIVHLSDYRGKKV